MELFGTSIESIYLTILIISGVVTILYILFGDVLEGIAEATGFLNPTLSLAFITFASATGYLFELLTSFNHYLTLFLSIILAIILDVLLNVFVLIPLSSAEESLAYSENSLRGRVGKVIIPIPIDGFGEVIIQSSSGTIAKSAKCFENKGIAEGQKVLVIDVQDGVLLVSPYDQVEQYLL